MKTIIKIMSVQFDRDVLLLNAESNINIAGLKPKEQILVDPDHLSFIYLMDYENEYTYISIADFIWSELKQALECQSSVFLNIQESRILLPNFLEELTYLIENIIGNANYGEQMVDKVEQIFR